MKILVAGWFSFEQMGATAGDLYSKDIVCEWLGKENLEFDVAFDAPFEGGVKWNEVDPKQYTHVIFLCGPFGNGWPVTDFLEYFSESKLIGINLSMLQSLDEWNPFDLLLERDSSRKVNPDLVFLSNKPHVPVVGLILVEPQKEYGSKARHQEANKLIKGFLDKQHCAVVPIDTRLDIPNKGGLRTSQEIESLIARMDVVVTTRLHGMVLALKNNVPVLAVDAIEGGAKIAKQADVIGWPNVFIINEFSKTNLQQAFNFCLSEEAKIKALQYRKNAEIKLIEIKNDFLEWFSTENEEMTSES